MSVGQEPLKVVGLGFSPRLEGNSDILLMKTLAGAASTGANTEQIWVGGANIGDCTECNFCYSTGSCKFQDDFQPIMNRIVQADRLVIATPLFFSSIPASAKRLVDRCQTYWVRRYRLQQALPCDPNQHFATVLAVGNTREMTSFVGVEVMMAQFFTMLGFSYTQNLYVGQVHQRGNMQNQANILAAAFEFGKALGSCRYPVPEAHPQTTLLQCR